ncbi:unnamed protein product [Owenia fusiformis]|uniref:Uncharacterized protein n=1 Tax=Owenia fusiformis TaxID=6347 RepID=A0A8J1XW75_OWEFU|nr:unnamed protein product [Owenia fusiformis]
MSGKPLLILTALVACILYANASDCNWTNRVKQRRRWCDDETDKILQLASTISVTITPPTTQSTTESTTAGLAPLQCLCGQDGYKYISSSCTSCGQDAGCIKVYDEKRGDEVTREEAEERCNFDGAHLVRWTNDQCLEDIKTFLKDQGYQGRKAIQFWSCGVDPDITFKGFPEPLGCGECEEGPGGPPPRRPKCYAFSYTPKKKKTAIVKTDCNRGRNRFICQRMCA